MLAGQFIFFASVCMSEWPLKPEEYWLGVTNEFYWVGEFANTESANRQLTAFRIYKSIFQYLLLDIHFQLSFQLLFSFGCLKPKLLFLSSAFPWNDKWPDAPKVRERGKWVSSACIQEKDATARKEGDDLCFLEMGWRGCWVPTRIVWNVNISLQGPQDPCGLFLTWRCLHSPGPHFPLPCKHIPWELLQFSLWISHFL